MNLPIWTSSPLVSLASSIRSLNGTYLNRERIDEAKLTNGDEVQIGKFKLVFLTGGEV